MNSNKRTEIKKLKQDLNKNYILVEKEINEENTSEKLIEKNGMLQFLKVIGKRKLLKTSDYTRISNRAAYFLEKILEEEKSKFFQIKSSQEDKGNIEQFNEKNEHNNKVKNFAENIDPPSHIQLRDIHNPSATKRKLRTAFIFYVLPLVFLTKLSKLNSLGFMRFIFFIPLIIACPSINEAIKQYTTRKEAILMLFCMERCYKLDTEHYERYKNFMKENNLEFRQLMEIKDKNIACV